MEEVNNLTRMITEGLSVRQINKITDLHYTEIKNIAEKAGFSSLELKWLGKKEKERTIVGIMPVVDVIKVYDLSVEKQGNFCTNWGVVYSS